MYTWRKASYKQRTHARNLWYEFHKWRSWYFLLNTPNATMENLSAGLGLVARKRG